jgi:glycosyltransferase involved in cell wall biosynthesis
VGKQIFDSTIFNEKFDNRFINILVSNSINNTGIVNVRKVLKTLILYLKVLFYLFTFRPEIVYFAITASGTAFYRDFFLVVLLKIFRFKLVYHLHNKGFNKKTNFFKTFCNKIVFNNVKVILLSKHLYYDIQNFVESNDIFICPNGITDNAFVKNRNHNDVVKILFISNLIKTKGILNLVEALSILKIKNLSFHCDIIGDEGDVTFNDLQKRINQENLTNELKVLGARYGFEKEEFYRNADIFVFPTYYETFGLVNLEAMSYSLPIISTFEGGIQDLILDNITGLLVNPLDIKALASKIEFLIKNEDIRFEMGKNGRLRFEDSFTLEIFENRLFKIIDSI